MLQVRGLVLALVPILSGMVAGAQAQVRGDDRYRVRMLVYQTVYLRVEAPSNDAVRPFLEASPGGYTYDRLVGLAEAEAAKKSKSSGVYWAFRPNDAVKWGNPQYDGDRITVWFEGQKDELRVAFVQIKTLDDFKKAFDLVFSPVPLQNEHPEWPENVRNAIGDRQLVNGMTRQQASCVVGTPVRVESGREGGEEIVAWYLRQETGDRRRGRLAQTGFPVMLRFVDDRLTGLDK